MEKALLQMFLEEGLSLDAIAEKVGRAPSTISYWLNRHGLVANGAARFGTKEALQKTRSRAWPPKASPSPS